VAEGEVLVERSGDEGLALDLRPDPLLVLLS
jgi:hypothetical protein